MKTILLLEDDPTIMELFRAFLERSGYAILAAKNGEEALRVSEDTSQTIDLLMADVFLHGFNGVEVARRITVTRPGLKILFISGYPLELAPRGILPDPGKTESERVFFLQKPFTRLTLLPKIAEIIGSER
jgi:two-component system cell cycle sensor histidine kinase/response regulator CckA